MEAFFNDDNSGGVIQTKNGPVTFSMDGNEVCLRQTKTSHRLDGMDLSTLTMQYMYDKANNQTFNKWNPGRLDHDIFIINPSNGMIGIYLEIMQRDDEDVKYAMELYRYDVGSIMEVLFVMGALGQNLCDCEGNSYKFATLIGVSDIFDRYVQILQANSKEASMNWLMYVAGLVRGYCEMNADGPDDIANIVNEVTLTTENKGRI